MRAVAPPYPGARTTLNGVRARILRTRVVDPATPPTLAPMLDVRDARLLAHCGGGGTLAILALELDGAPVDPRALAARLGPAPFALPGGAAA